jgi:hypothetical protein
VIQVNQGASDVSRAVQLQVYFILLAFDGLNGVFIGECSSKEDMSIGVLCGIHPYCRINRVFMEARIILYNNIHIPVLIAMRYVLLWMKSLLLNYCTFPVVI